MKKRLLLLSVLSLFLATTSWAYDFEADGIYYNVLSDSEVSVTYGGTSSSSALYSGTVVIPDFVTYGDDTYTVVSIGDYAFRYCSDMSQVNIPNSVSKIGDRAFESCTGLTEVTIPENVTTIGGNAFIACSGLTKVNFNAISLTSEGYCEKNGGGVSINSVFGMCDNFSTLTFGDKVTTIPDWLFSFCKGLTEVVIPNSVTTIDDGAFEDCTGLTSFTIPNSVTEIGNWTFYGCTGLTEVTIGNSVTEIGDYAFYGCTGLAGITIPNSVTEIGNWTFAYCTGLTEVTIGNSVTEIGNWTFCNCTGLTGTLNIPESVTEIGDCAFCNCTGLTSVTIGNSVTTIGSSAFNGCSSLTSITSLNPEPPSCDGYVFYNVNTGTCILYVPYGSIGAYANASTWSSFYNIVEIEVDAIADITTNGNAEAISYYTTDGKKVPTLQRGINIIRYSDGTAKKVLVK